MSNSYSLNLDADNVLHVGGSLTFATVNDVLCQAEPLLTNVATFDIDLIGVTLSDSAGVALLVHWMRDAGQYNKDIVFRNIPAQILAIANASDLDTLLPVA